MTTITSEMLADACSGQQELFNVTFKSGRAKINARNWKRAIAAGLQVTWLARLLNQQAWAEYQKVRGPAWAEYEKVRESALAEYEKVCGPALAEYKKVRGPALFALLKDQKNCNAGALAPKE
jgi:hypothetical protein